MKWYEKHYLELVKIANREIARRRLEGVIDAAEVIDEVLVMMGDRNQILQFLSQRIAKLKIAEAIRKLMRHNKYEKSIICTLHEEELEQSFEIQIEDERALQDFKHIELKIDLQKLIGEKPAKCLFPNFFDDDSNNSYHKNTKQKIENESEIKQLCLLEEIK